MCVPRLYSWKLFPRTSLEGITASTSFLSSPSFWIPRKMKFFPSEINPDTGMTNLGQNITLQLFSICLLAQVGVCQPWGRKGQRDVMVPYSLWAGGASGVVRTGAVGRGVHREPGTLALAPQALVSVGFALDSCRTIAIVGSVSPSQYTWGLPPPCDDGQAALCRSWWVQTHSFERWELLFPLLVPAQILVSFSFNSSKHFCSLLYIAFSRMAVFSSRPSVSTSEVWQHKSTERW